jgi:hypothetical protein
MYLCIYTHVWSYIYIHIYNEKENKIVLVILSEGTMGGETGKEDVREWKVLKQPIYIWI